MSQSISFSGLVGGVHTPSEVHLFSGTTPPVSLSARTPTNLDQILQEFFHYMGHIWVHNHNPPQTVDDLSAFNISEAVDAYRSYQSSGGNVPIDKGLDLESTYLMAQVLAQKPFICLLNREKEDISTPRMARVRHLLPGELIAVLQRNYLAKLDTGEFIRNQVDRSGNVASMYTTLVYDGETGHCIILVGVEQGSDRLVLWDPWPLGSLLCYENNIAGVAAKPVPSGETYWTVSVEEMARVVYAVFVPA